MRHRVCESAEREGGSEVIRGDSRGSSQPAAVTADGLGNGDSQIGNLLPNFLARARAESEADRVDELRCARGGVTRRDNRVPVLMGVIGNERGVRIVRATAASAGHLGTQRPADQ